MRMVLKWRRAIILFLTLMLGCAQMPVVPESNVQAAPSQPAAPQPTALQPSPVPSVTAEPASTANPNAPEKKPNDELSLAFGGSVYIALENWSKVGMADDSKIGGGFGGDLGIGIKVSDMKALIGPHLAYNRWSANYSKKASSATSSVYVEMVDAGALFTFDFSDFFIKLGLGTSKIASGMVVDNQDIKYQYDGESCSYKSVVLGMSFDHFLLGIGYTSYSGYARDASRAELSIGYGF